MLPQIIREDLLHYVWKTKQINIHNLQTTKGLPVKIIDWGTHNHDSGPDFFNGKAVIGDTTWVGNIEMHIFSSDWHKHSHDSDPAYDNVILHVVYEHDREAYTSQETELVCIEIADRISSGLKANYSRLLQSTDSIPCKRLIAKVDDFTIAMWKDRLIAERLESKSRYIKSILEQYTQDWESTFYVILARYMGSRVNVEAFEALAKALPLSVIRKCQDDLHKIESLIYGVAGMLESTHKDDDYHQSLTMEYKHQSSKHSLQHIPPVMWKFSKMRPANFPTIRLAQLASLLYKHPTLFTKVLESKSVVQLRTILAVSPSSYWDEHYRFGKQAANKSTKQLTDSFMDLLIINVVAPTLFLYGLEKGEMDYTERAIGLLEELKSEKNTVITTWKELGVSSDSAMDSQALIHLKKQYCDHKKCLSCNIGSKIVLL